MWTKSARARMARIDGRSKRYPSDLTDEEWTQIAPFFERIFGHKTATALLPEMRWMTRWRHLVRDFESRIDVSEAMIHITMGAILLRRNAHP